MFTSQLQEILKIDVIVLSISCLLDTTVQRVPLVYTDTLLQQRYDIIYMLCIVSVSRAVLQEVPLEMNTVYVHVYDGCISFEVVQHP